MSHFLKEAGYHLDNTSDLARVIRVPGTVNRKTEPVPVQVMEYYPDRRYGYRELYETIEKLYSELPKTQAPPGGGQKSQPANYPPARAELILDRCAFLRHCKDNAATLPEPDWYAMVTIIVRTEEGPDLVHELSAPYPGYDPKETDQKIDHALKDTGPMTCQGIQEKCGGKYCQGCRWNGKIKSPVVLGHQVHAPIGPFVLWFVGADMDSIYNALDGIRAPQFSRIHPIKPSII
ncbi:MAG: hypothetical protein AB1556_02875 [Bacillota bacterium]